MEKQRKNGFNKFIAVVFILALIAIVLAAILGATFKENWVDAAGKLRAAQGLHEIPILCEKSFDAGEIDALSIDLSGGSYTVKSHDEGEIKVTYHEDYAGENVCEIEGGVLKIDRTMIMGGMVSFNGGEVRYGLGVEWLLLHEYADMTILLPRSLSLDSSEINVNGGSLSGENLSLGDGKVTINGGAISFKNCDFGDVELFKVNGGAINFEGCNLENIEEIRVNGGLIKLKDCVLSKVGSVRVNGGKAEIGCKRLVGTTEIRVSGGTATLNMPQISDSEIRLEINTSGGRVYLNNQKKGEGVHGQSDAILQLKIHVSGGTAKINSHKS